MQSSGAKAAILSPEKVPEMNEAHLKLNIEISQRL